VTGVTVRGGRSEVWRVAFKVEDAKFQVQHLTLKDDSKVNLSDKDGLRAVRETKKVRALFKLRSDRQWSGSFVHPLVNAPAGGRFGSRRVINQQPRNAHTGADYGAPKGEHVRATNSGTVVLAEEHFFAGNSIFIDHGDGLVTMYFHLDKILVEKGQTIKKGEIIGHVGSTGRSSGPHLHFGVNYRGARINPASLLERNLE
jgi:murein DD-endopeptidase MepM/ murein hydrolase activator NlpD